MKNAPVVDVSNDAGDHERNDIGGADMDEVKNACRSRPQHIRTLVFPETSFTAVTAYKNLSSAQLNTDSNPYSRAFRDSSRLSEFISSPPHPIPSRVPAGSPPHPIPSGVPAGSPPHPILSQGPAGSRFNLPGCLCTQAYPPFYFVPQRQCMHGAISPYGELLYPTRMVHPVGGAWNSILHVRCRTRHVRRVEQDL